MEPALGSIAAAQARLSACQGVQLTAMTTGHLLRSPLEVSFV